MSKRKWFFYTLTLLFVLGLAYESTIKNILKIYVLDDPMMINHEYYKAFKRDETLSMKYLKSKGATFNVLLPSLRGQTPLTYYILRNNIQGIKKLLELGADIEMKNSFNLTPLYIAALNNKEKAVSLLLHHEAIINKIVYNHYTPLSAAIYHGHNKIAKLLIKYGAFVNPIRKQKIYATPLGAAIASKKRNYEMVEYLLNYGVDLQKFRGGYKKDYLSFGNNPKASLMILKKLSCEKADPSSIDQLKNTAYPALKEYIKKCKIHMYKDKKYPFVENINRQKNIKLTKQKLKIDSSLRSEVTDDNNEIKILEKWILIFNSILL